MNLKEAIDYMQAEIDDCRGEKCFDCRRKSLVINELKASQNRERDVFRMLSENCQHASFFSGCSYDMTIAGLKCVMERCPLLKEGGK